MKGKKSRSLSQIPETKEGQLSSRYDPRTVEEKWYKFWLDKGYFHADYDPQRKPYTIVIPPPNVTGSLHMGHALNGIIQDILIRWKRMQGYNTLWLPGTDHAGIATQNVVEKELAGEGLTRHDLGREKFIERVWQWKEKYGNTIVNQLKRLGCSCDWKRLRFTMDEGYSQAIREVFVRLYEKGWIYRDKYIINWCPRCLTAISDLEVEHREIPSRLYYIRYPLEDGSGDIVVATTRPETMLGDTAVAVHPEDKRYHHLVGKIVILPPVGRRIPIISDKYIDPEFGTGCLKVTPAHDVADFEISRRHGLPVVVVIDENGRMTPEAGKYQGMDRFHCRKEILKELVAQKYLIKEEDYLLSLGHCARCHTVIEPHLSEQWFVRMKALALPALEAVSRGEVRFIPSRWVRLYLEWIENIRDWCISRQIWWGHRIPVWVCFNCGNVIASCQDPDFCTRCQSKNLEQDPDVLDTWFSSALWPFATLGWPEETEDLKYFYPTDVLVTARDILYLWVARMIMMGLEYCQEIPFREVYIYPTVLNPEGRRMSKSLGTGVDPLELIDDYGADAVRFGLIIQNTQLQDIRFSEEKVKMSRNFNNKIWNASRLVLMNLKDFTPAIPPRDSRELADRWILSRLNRLINEVTNFLKNYELETGAQQLYDFFWHEYCDWYLELVKLRLGKENIYERKTAQYFIWSVLETSLRLLHPFIPFITEEIWQLFPHEGESIMISSWPVYKEAEVDPEAEERMIFLQKIIIALRNIRSEMNLPPTATIKVNLGWEDNGKTFYLLEEGKKYIRHLARVEELNVGVREPHEEMLATAMVSHVEVGVNLSAHARESELRRLRKEIGKIELQLRSLEKKLNHPGFLEKAPPDIVNREKERLEKIFAIRNKLLESQEKLKKKGENTEQ